MKHTVRIDSGSKHRDSSVSRTLFGKYPGLTAVAEVRAITRTKDWLASVPCDCSLPLRTLPFRSVLDEICARVLPVAVTYADSGLAAAVAIACNFAFTDRGPVRCLSPR